ncbi:HipA domain-containing protein [Allofournierella sp.]
MSVSFEGHLMSRNIPLARFGKGGIHVLQPALLPFHFAHGGSLEDWLRSRAMDCHSRTNARMLRKALRISDEAPELIPLQVDAATITDTYWLKPQGSALQYQDVCFRENAYWKFALNGPSVDDFSRPFSRTPELTNTGSFEKCWKLEPDGEWWLYKHGKPENVFSELMAYRLGRWLGYNMAEYEQVDAETVRTRDFTRRASVNFEPARALGLKSDQHLQNYESLYGLAPALALDYARMVTLDALIYNADRHAGNFGVLRDVDTGKVLGLAPNYDNNLSLLALHIPNEQAGADFLKDWQNLMLFHHVPIQLPPLAPGQLGRMAGAIRCDVDKEKAVAFLQYRYDHMQQAIERNLSLNPIPPIEL